MNLGSRQGLSQRNSLRRSCPPPTGDSDDSDDMPPAPSESVTVGIRKAHVCLMLNATVDRIARKRLSASRGPPAGCAIDTCIELVWSSRGCFHECEISTFSSASL